MHAQTIVSFNATKEGERVEGVDPKGPVYPPPGSIVVVFPNGARQLLAKSEFDARFTGCDPTADPSARIAELEADLRTTKDELAALKLETEGDEEVEDPDPVPDDIDDAEEDEEE